MTAAAPEHFADIVALSEAMLRHAEHGEWLELAALEARRQALIATAMRPPAAAASAGYVHAAQRILELDQRTAALAQAGHDSLAKLLHLIHTGRSAVQAYAQQAP